MSRLPVLVRRVIALALLGFVLWLVWQFAVLPVASHVARVDETIDHNRQLIARLSRTIAAGDTGDAQIRSLHDELRQSGRYILAETEPLAAARMQEHLKAIVTEVGGALQSVQSLPSKDEEGLKRIGVRVMMRGDYAGLLRVMYGLETGQPALFIDNLQIKTDPRRRRSEDPGIAEPVSLIFEIFGYLPPELG